jgi:glutamate dehydrogenase (NAD(P)+)
MSQGVVPTLPVETTNPLYASALSALDHAAQALELDAGIWQILRHSKRELTVHFPVRMDDGSVRVFEGFRIQHNVVRGPARAVSATTLRLTLTKCGPWPC